MPITKGFSIEINFPLQFNENILFFKFKFGDNYDAS
jgi:hypothetical protein